MLISIVFMVSIDYIIGSRTGLKTQKLVMPEGLVPSKTDPDYRIGWFVSMFGSYRRTFPLWTPFAAIVPASLIFIVMFFEQELIGIMLNSKTRKLRKGTGFNIDLLLGGMNSSVFF